MTEREAELRDALEDMLYQFAYKGVHNKTAVLSTGGLSALEDAFEVMGWDDPHPVPEIECDEPGCHEHRTCGWPSGRGYRRTCGKHMRRSSDDSLRRH
jgi:hypothetical protein